MKLYPFMRILFIIVLMHHCGELYAQNLRWHLAKDKGIEWLVKKDSAHLDHIEMSGRQVALILTYGVNKKYDLVLEKKVVFPMLRTIPNNTFGNLIHDFDQSPPILLNGKTIHEQPAAFSFNGSIKVRSSVEGVSIEREIYPSVDKAAVIEQCILKNEGSRSVQVTIPKLDKTDSTKREKGVYGVYILSSRIYGSGKLNLLPGEQYVYAIVSSARKASDQPYEFSSEYESLKRKNFVKELRGELVLQTPDDTLNQMFSFAKIRALESIYDTKNGLMHGPGGGAYYAAIWANDEGEYMNPFFPFLGNAAGNEAAMNSLRLFATYMNPEYKPIPSSIIAEGTDIWNGAGDRGDQAMIAYGAARFALAYGDKTEAQKLWPLIDWCLEFLRRKKNAEGVIASDSDEMEGRIPAGKINLSTNSLAYGALVSASDLAITLGKKTIAENFIKEAAQLRKDIDKYFGANVQGFDTYRYFDGNTKLRSWIGMPLVMGILERKDQTLKALFSDYLWTKDGMRSESGGKIFWDRSLLYAMRGFFNGGATDTTLKYLKLYSSKRLLGEHVPYAVEAWPEGDQRHLSAESGLYCRVITEGLFGIRPTSFNKFYIQPTLPRGWNKMALNHIKAFNNDFNITVTRVKEKVKITVSQTNGKNQEILWDGKAAIEVTL